MAEGIDINVNLQSAAGTFWFCEPVLNTQATYSVYFEVWEFSADYQTPPFAFSVGAGGAVTIQST